MFNKRLSTYIITAVSLFLSAVEYAIILPTLNDFLLSLDAQPFYIGLALSAMSLSSLVTSPIYGRITDITKTTKVVVITSNFFEIGGNIMYFLATNPIMIVISRIVVGIGAGSASSVLGMISNSSSKSERTTLMSRIYAGRQAGLLLGPACNFFLEHFNFKIGFVTIDKHTAPGFFMAIVWCIHTILLVLFYFDLEYLDESSKDKNTSSLNSVTRFSWQQICKDLFREENIVILALTFTIMFVQCGVEAVITPLSYRLFGWGSIDNSIYYSVSGALYVVSLVSLAQISKKISDRKLTGFGLICLTIDNFMFLVFAIYSDGKSDGSTWQFIVFILYGVFLALFMAYCWIPILSLFTKFTSEENQGFFQGIRLVYMRGGQILGPIWAASLLDNLTLMTGANFALLFFFSAMFFVSYPRLTTLERQFRKSDSEENAQDNEKSPLLS